MKTAPPWLDAFTMPYPPARRAHRCAHGMIAPQRLPYVDHDDCAWLLDHYTILQTPSGLALLTQPYEDRSPLARRYAETHNLVYTPLGKCNSVHPGIFTMPAVETAQIVNELRAAYGSE